MFVDTRKKGKTQIDKYEKIVFDLKSSHFKERGFHVGTHELVFVFFAADSICEWDESVKIIESFET